MPEKDIPIEQGLWHGEKPNQQAEDCTNPEKDIPIEQGLWHDGDSRRLFIPRPEKDIPIEQGLWLTSARMW